MMENTHAGSSIILMIVRKLMNCLRFAGTIAA